MISAALAAQTIDWCVLTVEEHWNVLELESWKMWTIVPR